MIFIKFHLQEQILQMQISSFLTRTREQAGHETLAQILKRRLQSPVCFWSCNYCTCLWRPQSDGHTRLSRQIDVNINIRGSVNIADVRQQAHKCNCSWAECDSSASESVFLALACWACWGFGAWEVFGEETRDDKWPQERCLVSSSVCVCMYCGLLILRRSRDQSAQGPTFYASVLNMQMQPVDFFFFFSLRPPSSDSIKNLLVIRFCAAVGSAFSFFLPTTVGGEEWKGGGGNHVRSTQRAPKLDHVSAPTRSLRMRHKSPLMSWKMAGNQMCTTYGINATEMSLLTKNKKLSVWGKVFISFRFISHYYFLFFMAQTDLRFEALKLFPLLLIAILQWAAQSSLSKCIQK